MFRGSRRPVPLAISAARSISIFSTATFHWIQDHERLFAELQRCLATPEAALEAQCGGGPNLAAHPRARRRARAGTARFRSQFVGWQEPWHFASPDETEHRLRRVGFRAAHCWLEHAPTTFPDADRFRDFVETVVLRPYLARALGARICARDISTRWSPPRPMTIRRSLSTTGD